MRFFPEAVALAAGVAAWYGVNRLPPDFNAGLRGMMALSLVASLVSAVAYRMAERPKMWSYLTMQFLAYAVFSILTYSPTAPNRPPNDLGPFLYLLSLIVVGLYLLPAIPVCVVYQATLESRFGQNSSEREDDA